MNVPVQEKSNTFKPVSGAQAAKWPACEDQQENFSVLVAEVSSSVKKYCFHRTRVVAGTIFAIGFILGWRMRPW